MSTKRRLKRHGIGPGWVMLLGIALAGGARLPAQEVAAPAVSAPVGPTTEVAAPGVASLGSGIISLPAAPGSERIPDELQVVRFNGPPGLFVEVLGPAAQQFAALANDGALTTGLQVGVGYWLRVANIPGRENREFYAYIEVVGHLHRPANIDPLKYPIRVMLSAEDIDDVLDRGRMVTQVVYLEDPEQAIPLHLPKDEIPVIGLNPAEEPLKVAGALGRIMAIVRLGSRVPSTDEVATGATSFGMVGGRCPFVSPESAGCSLPCGPITCSPPPPGRPWLPRDEYLCDGGDRGPTAKAPGDGRFLGVDPRDAVIQFRDDRRPRLLPTNTVCVYAPRFAAVRVGVGPNQAALVEVLKGAEQIQTQVIQRVSQNPVKLTMNQAPEQNRVRSRPSGAISNVAVRNHFELRVLDGVNLVTHVAGNVRDVGPQIESLRQMPEQYREKSHVMGIKTGEGAVVTGIVEGAGERVMAWKPQELASVEEPPNKPGLAVVKQVNASEAEPGDTLTYKITYRNMGNIPVTSVSVIDSLLPRLEYVKGSAQGPKGAVFTARENEAGSTELRWDIGVVPAGETGAVSFQAKVR